jgi:hypothetical protein
VIGLGTSSFGERFWWGSARAPRGRSGRSPGWPEPQVSRVGSWPGQRPRRVAALLPVLLGLLTLAPAGAQTLDRTRTILLPREEFLRLGQSYPQGVYLDGADLERLQARIAAVRAAAAAKGESGPIPLSLASASYQAELLPGKLRVEGRLDLVSDRKGWQSIELPALGDLFLAEFTEGEAYLTRQGNRTRVDAFGAGPRGLKLGFDVPLQGEGAVLDLGSPGELVLSAPESIEPALDGTPLAPLPQIDEPGTRQYRIPLRRKALAIQFRPRQIPAAAALIEATGTHRLRVEQGYLRGEHELEIYSWSAPMQELDLALPEGSAVSSIESPELQAHEVRDGRLHLVLARPCRELRLRLQTLRPVEAPFSLRASLPSVVGARWSTAFAEVERAEALEVRVQPAGGAQALPAAPPDPEQASRLCGRFFLAGADAALSITAEPARRSVQAALSGVYRLTADALRLSGAVRLQVSGTPLQTIELELDAQDRLLEVALDGSTELAWENRPAADPKRQLLRVNLPAQGGGVLSFRAERLLDRSALDAGPVAIEIQPLRIAGIEAVHTAVGIGVDPDLHLSLRDRSGYFLRDAEASRALFEDVDPSAPSTQPLSYALLAAPDAAPLVLELSRRQPRLEAETTTFVHFTEGALKVQAEVRFTIREAAADTLRLALPPGTGSRIRIDVEGLQERALKSTAQADVWTLRLREKAAGQVYVRVGFDQPLDPGLQQTVQVPEIGADGASRDEGTVLLEAADNLALRVLRAEGRELQLEDVPAAAFYTPSDRLLAAYRTLARPYGLEVEMLRYEPLPLLGAVATQADLRTVVLADGRLWTEASYALNNAAAQFLPVALPPETRLWSALVDGQPVKPFRRAGSVLLPLRPGAQGVRLLYETRVPEPGLYAGLQLTPPDIGLPTLRLNWQLHPPAGYEAYAQGFGRDAGLEQVRPRLPELLEELGEGMGWLFLPYRTMLLGASLQETMPGTPGARAPVYGTEATTSPPMSDAAPSQLKSLGYVGDRAAGASDHKGGRADMEAKAEAGKQKLEKPEAKPVTLEPEQPRIPASGTVAEGIGVLPLRLSLPADTPPLGISALSGEGGVRLYLARSDLLGRLRAGLVLGVAAACVLLVGLRLRRWLFTYCAILLVLALLPAVGGLWLTGIANAATDGILLGAAVTLLIRWYRRSPRPLRARALPALALVSALAGSAQASPPRPEPSGAESAEPTTVFVPYHLEAGRVIEEARAFLAQEQFRKLFELGQTPQAPAVQPPAAFALRALDLTGALDTSGATLQMRLDFELPGDGWAEIPLAPAGSIESALLDGAPVALVSNGGLRLVAHGHGSHRLALGLRVPDADPGRDVLLRLPLPPAAAGRLELRMPAGFTAEVTPDRGAELRSGGQATVLVAAISGPEVTIRARLAPVELAGGLRVENWLELRAAPGRFGLAGRLVLGAAGTLPEQLVLDAAPGLVLTALRGAGLRSWKLEGGQLALSLEPGLERVSLELDGDLGPGPQATLSALSPQGAGGVSGGVIVRPGAGVVLQLGQHPGLRQAEQAEVLAAWPQAQGAVQWVFVPEAPRFSLSLRSESGKPSVSCRPSLLLRVDEPGADLVLAADCEVREWPVYELPVSLPEGWRFEAGRADVPASWSVEAPGARSLARAQFPQGVIGRVRLVTHWSRGAGAGFASSLAVPFPELGPAELQPGELALSAAEGLELTLEGAGRSKLTPLDPAGLQARLEAWPVAQAYRFREPFEAAVRLRPQTARATVTAVEHVLVGESHLEGRALLLYESSPPGVDLLRFSVPPDVARTLEVSGAGVRNVEKAAADGAVEVTVELHSPVPGSYPLEVSWTVPLELGREAPLPRILPESPAPADAYVLVETDPVVLVSVTAQTEAEVVGDIEQIPSLPSSLRPEQVRWMYRYRGPGGALRVKVERPRTEDVLQAIVDSVDLLSVVDSEGRCRTRARFEMQNRTEQFLDVTLPADAELWSAAVAGQPVKPARAPSGRTGELRVPLPKQSAADLSFAAELWYVSRVPLSGLRGSFDLNAPRVTNIPIKRTLWTLWLPAELGLSFSGTIEEASEGELTSEKVLEVLDLQNRLVGALSSSAGRKRQKIVQNLASLREQYSQLDQTAQQQLSGLYGADDARESGRKKKALDQLTRSRASFDENLRKVEQAAAEDRQAGFQQQAAQQAPAAQFRQSLTEHWALTGKGVEQMSQSPALKVKAAPAQRAGSEEVDLESVVFASQGEAAEPARPVEAFYQGLEPRLPADVQAGGSEELLRNLFPGLAEQLQPALPPPETTRPGPLTISETGELQVSEDRKLLAKDRIYKTPATKTEEPAKPDSGLSDQAKEQNPPPASVASSDEEAGETRRDIDQSREEPPAEGQDGERSSSAADEPANPSTVARPMVPAPTPTLAAAPPRPKPQGLESGVPGGVVGGVLGRANDEADLRGAAQPRPPVEVQTSVHREGYLSLKLDFPVEGQRRFFKALQGDGTLRVHYTSGRVWGQMQALLAVALGLAGLWALSRLGAPVGRLLAMAGRGLRRHAGLALIVSLGLFFFLWMPAALLLAAIAAVLLAGRLIGLPTR